MITIRLTDGMQSALECAGLDLSDDTPVLVAAWNGRARLRFDPANLDALVSEICECSNSEDATAEQPNQDPDVAKYARRACRSLSALADRVIRAWPKSAVDIRRA